MAATVAKALQAAGWPRTRTVPETPTTTLVAPKDPTGGRQIQSQQSIQDKMLGPDPG